MSAYESVTIPVPATSPVDGAAVRIENLCDKWLVATGFDTDEIDFQISLDGGTTWVTPADLDGLIANTASPIEIPQAATHIRCHTVSGSPTIVATLRGLELAAAPPLSPR